jgi:hypothetical protein
LLKGKAIDKLDDAALERKYPPNLIAKRSYFLDYERHYAFGWFFDPDLCKIAALTDYQRLVLFNDVSTAHYFQLSYASRFNMHELTHPVTSFLFLSPLSGSWANIFLICLDFF